MATLAQEIETYLLTHPNASDTIEGVIKWWIALQRYQQAREDVQEALEFLVAEGAVVKRKLSDGRFIYAKAAEQRNAKD